MLHLRGDEIIALKEGNYFLLKEYEKHLAECLECQKNLNYYDEMTQTFLLLSNNQAKISSVAEKSFEFINKEPLFIEKIKSFFTYKTKAVAAFSFLIVFILAAFWFFKTQVNIGDGEVIQIVKAPVVETKESQISLPKYEELSETELVAEIGANFKVDRAKIAVLKKSHIKKIDNSNIALSEGKIECDVEKGGNFIVHVSQNVLVRVLGTRFTVDAAKSGVFVSVSEGVVEVINKKTGFSQVLKKDMETKISFEEKEIKNLPALTLAQKREESVKTKIEEKEISDYEKGIAALKEKRYDDARAYFEAEIEKGNEKGKALFETLRIFEGERDFSSVVKYLKKYKNIADSDSVYKEEFYIKGCFSELRLAKKLSFCEDYLKSFPDGYKRAEIIKLMGENNE